MITSQGLNCGAVPHGSIGARVSDVQKVMNLLSLGLRQSLATKVLQP
jgi:hypothetical protein